MPGLAIKYVDIEDQSHAYLDTNERRRQAFC